MLLFSSLMIKNYEKKTDNTSDEIMLNKISGPRYSQKSPSKLITNISLYI